MVVGAAAKAAAEILCFQLLPPLAAVPVSVHFRAAVAVALVAAVVTEIRQVVSRVGLEILHLPVHLKEIMAVIMAAVAAELVPPEQMARQVQQVETALHHPFLAHQLHTRAAAAELV